MENLPTFIKMLKSIPVRPRLAQKSSMSFAIVASHYNEQYVQPLVDHATKELKSLEHGCAIHMVSVPGAFEIPLMVQTIAEKERYSAILALGVVLQGETGHAHLIAEAVTNALLNISLVHRVPVIHGVLLLPSEEHARVRCIESETNRGTEAARAAVAAARTLQESK